MKPLSTIVVSVVLLLVMATQTGAQTTAYIPNQGDETITRVMATDETFDSVALDDAGDDNPFGAAVTPDGLYVFVTLSDTDQVIRIPVNNFSNPAAQINIDVGDDPRGVAVEPQGDYAYVANFGSDSVTKINISTTAIVGDPIPVGNGPLGVAAAYDQENSTPKVYVTNNLGNSLTVITDSDETTISSLCSGPSGVAVTPDGNFVYVACTGDDEIKVIRSSNNTVIATLDAVSDGIGDEPYGVAVGSDGQYVFVTNRADNTVTIITTSDNTVIETQPVGTTPMGVAAPRNGDFAYVVNQVDDSIHVIDMTTDPATVTEIGIDELDVAVSLGAFIGDAPPSAPSGLTAETVDSNEVDLTWTDNASDELGFKIERREDSEGVYVQVAKVDENETEYTDTGLSRGTTYHYRVRAFNEASDSDYSSSSDATTDDEQFSWCFINSMIRQ